MRKNTPLRVSTRATLNGLGLIFAIYLATRGVMWTAPVAHPVLLVSIAMLLVVITIIVLFAGPLIPVQTSDAPLTAGKRGPSVLPVWAACLALASMVVVPTAVALSAGEAGRSAPYATAYLGGAGAILTIVMVRRRAGFAWWGAFALTVGACVWLGPVVALAQGLTGSLMWIASAQLLLRSLDRAARDTVRLVELQQAAVAWQTAQGTRRRERRRRVQYALQVAGPVLARIIESGGELTEAERLEALVAEGSLRDELRGARLMDEGVRAELDAARRRGASVTVYDDGGLDGLDAHTIGGIRAELASVIAAARSDRLIIRTVRGDDIAVTVVGRTSATDGAGDEEDVDIWHEIPRQREIALHADPG